MKRHLAYLLASLLCLTSCASTVVVPPPQKENPKPVAPIDPLSRWFDRATHENDPYPSVCSLRRQDGSLIGSGVLIRPDVVLTAAHCIDEADVFSIRIGLEDIMVKETVLHPKYNPIFIRNDIGLIFLECDSIYPVAKIGCINWLHRYQEITTVGYSRGYKKSSKPKVFKYFGRVISEPCSMKFIPRSTSIFFGDSGGGVFAKVGGEEYLFGIMSFFRVDENFNGLTEIVENSATVVSLYVEWIEEVINERTIQGVVR